MRSKRKQQMQGVIMFIAVLLLLFTSPVSTLSQTETGQITVKATDPQGAVVPGATVTLKSVERGTTLPPVTTNDEGIAVVPNINPACTKSW